MTALGQELPVLDREAESEVRFNPKADPISHRIRNELPARMLCYRRPNCQFDCPFPTERAFIHFLARPNQQRTKGC
jgi:hypothetical protein